MGSDTQLVKKIKKEYEVLYNYMCCVKHRKKPLWSNAARLATTKAESTNRRPKLRLGPCYGSKENAERISVYGLNGIQT